MLVFTQFREITEPLAEFLATLFGRAGLVLHGGTSVKKRKDWSTSSSARTARRSSSCR